MHDVLTGARRCGAAAAAVAVLLSSCADVESGTPTTAPATPSVTAVDPASLDSGDYPTEPSPPRGAAGTEEAGRLVEGRRMAGAVAGPWQVDPAFTRSAGTAANLLTEHRQVGEVVYPTTMYRTPNLDTMLVGFSAERSAADPADRTRLRNTVLRFPDPDTAAGVAATLTEGTLTKLIRTDAIDPIPIEPIRPVEAPGHPGLTGAVLTFREGTRTVHEAILVSARGPFVLHQMVRTEGAAERAVDLAVRTLDRQGPLLDRFTPTPVGQFAELPLDPTGLSARTVPSATPTPLNSGTYDAAGGLQLEADPLAMSAAFADFGVDVVSAGLTTVYQAADARAAASLAALLGGGGDESPPVPGLPDSRCGRHADAGGVLTRHRCAAAVDRYAFTATSRDLGAAHRQLAAQYLMLD